MPVAVKKNSRKGRLSIIARYQTVDSVMQFFSSSDLFITESIGWHSNFYHWTAKLSKSLEVQVD
jgi:hypothetical protein